MKKIVFGILVLVGAWQLVQLPSINAALFAFLTLGINPITNHPLSMPSLITILLTSGLVGLLLFFNRSLSDFFGGLSDWLTRANNSYGAVGAWQADTKLNLETMSLKKSMEVAREPKVMPATPLASSGFTASVRTFELPTLRMPHLKLYLQSLRDYYNHTLGRIHSRLRVAAEQQKQDVTVAKTNAYNSNFAPELAEVVAIFEQLAREVEAAEPQEAVIVEPIIPKRKPSLIVMTLRSAVADMEYAFGVIKHKAQRHAKQASRRASRLGVVTGNETRETAHRTMRALTRTFRITYRTSYHGILLGLLGMLLAVDRMMRALIMALHVSDLMLMVVFRKTYRALMLAAAAITLGMFATWRGFLACATLIGREFVAFCRGMYMLLSMGVMLAFLAAGYMLFVFTLVVFMVWEVCEPYTRKLDKWLGDKLGDDEGVTELAKVGREMSRTFIQWYNELRNIKRSVYR